MSTFYNSIKVVLNDARTNAYRAVNFAFGRRFDEREIRRIRQFYSMFPIRDALRPELSWTHYRLLLKVDNQAARSWYMNEAAQLQWSSRALERQINSIQLKAEIERDTLIVEQNQRSA